MSTYTAPTYADELGMMTNECRWANWPRLTLKHRTRRDADFRGMPEPGLLVSGHGPTVFKTLLFFDITDSTERIAYSSFEELLADGWVVD